MKSLILFSVTFMIAMTALTVNHADAQFHAPAPASPLPPDVLGPAPRIWWFGPLVGVNLTEHGGDISTGFCDCTFRDGSGTGFRIGAELGHMFNPQWGFAVKLFYDDMQAQYSNQILEKAPVWDPDPDKIEDVISNYERKLDVRLSYFVLNPMLHFYPVGGLYLMAGPGIGFSSTSTMEYTKTNLDGYIFKRNGEETAVIDRDSGEIQNVNSLRLDLRAGIGYALRLGRNISFAPEVTYNFPFTTISSSDDDWEASAINITAVLRIAI
jgi:hypothetical protein